MRRRGYFFVRLLATVLVVTVPLLAIHAWTLYRDLQSAQEKAYQQVRAKSVSAAREVEDTLAGAERLLTLVSRHAEIRSLDPLGCNEFLRGLESISPMHAVVSVLDLSGQAICISVKVMGQPPASAGNSEWFTNVLASDGFFLGEAAVGRITGKPVAPLSLPVRDALGKRIAIAVVSLDLLQLERLMVGDWPAKGGVLALIDKKSRFLVRSPETSKWLGRTASSAAMSARPGLADGVSKARGVDGVERIFAATDLSSYQLRVAASIPTEQVLAQPRAEIRNALIVSCAALLVAGLLAYFGADALARPVRSLARTARELASGRDEARADEMLPGEFRNLAIEMNSMHAARLQSEMRVQRVSRFYAAVSRTNQAILRLKEPAALYDAICRICVETGQASMAWIGVIDGDRLVPAAWGGPARRYTEGLDDIRLSPHAGAVPEAIGEAAIRDGRPHVANDYRTDPRTRPFQANAVPFDVRASAVVPFSQGGRVVANLNLYAKEVGFFDDELMRLLVGLGLDVSVALDTFERVAIHERTVLELARRESQLAGIVESATDAIITIDASHRVLVFNAAASRMFQVPVALAIGRSLDPLMPPRYRQSAALQVQSYARGDDGKEGIGPTRHLTGLRGDGVEFPVEISTFRTNNGAEGLITLVIRDVTGEHDADQARIAAAESSAANQAKTEFLSRMSHELRTPLNAVLGFSQLLQESAKDKLDEHERHQLDLIFLAGAQLCALVDDVLDVSVIESGQLSLSLSDFELETLLDGVVRMSEAAARQGGIRLVASYPTLARLSLHTDPIRLRQVMLNLVSNAIKYNRPGGSVTIDVAVMPERVRISVVDTGLGMTGQQLTGLFEPFNRLGRENSAIAGTGIGMALVRQLVQLMGGTISVQSEAGTGTEVRLELVRPPVVDAASDRARALAFQASAPSALDADLSGLVLYIEDNPVNVLVIRNVLRRWPAVQFVVAEDGASGIRQAAELRPDVVLLDMRLPDMSGIEVMKALRADARTRDLCVVALSASAMQHEVNVALAAGVQDYWTKPINVKSFCAGMRRLLEDHAHEPIA
ncbi:MAG: ATP-binding protein [Caldimonas sp.]